MPLRVGVDVGGTNIDVAVLDGARVLGAAKAPVSDDLLTAIEHTVQKALQVTRADSHRIELCMLGTTHFVNACVQCKALSKVAVIRLCGTATRALRPFCSLPELLCQATGRMAFMVAGGYEYDGGQEIAGLDEAEITRVVHSALQAGVQAFVICGVFAPVNQAQEQAAAGLVGRAVSQFAGAKPDGGVHVTLSHRIGQLGLLERENAAILNAALQPLASKLIPAFQQALANTGIQGQLYLTANDGTLMHAQAAMEMPIATFQSGPVNSLRGAAFLSGCSDGIVCDIGGTTTDVGRIARGLPCPCSGPALLAGARTNFRMPDVASIGLGGGSYIRDGGAGGKPSVGPDSVSHQIGSRALCFGGNDCTASDVAVVLQQLHCGSRAKAEAGLPLDKAQRAWAVMQQALEAAVDSAKSAPGDVPVIVVGGGAALCADKLAGASRVVHPPYATVANAVGAAFPQVSGSVDSVFSMGASGEHRSRVLQQAEAAARDRAMQAGADAASCRVVEQEEVPLSYLPGGITRMRIRVIGDLPIAQYSNSEARSLDNEAENIFWAGSQEATGEPQGEATIQSSSAQGTDDVESDPSMWRPQLDSSGAWLVSRRDVHALTIGTGMLGTGGGGSPYYASLKVLQELDRGHVIRVVSPAAVPDDELVAEGGGMGAPTVSLEKLQSHECEQAVAAAVKADPQQRKLWGVLSAEIGGGNGLEPLAIGARLALPVVDADYMGRAFPELQMMTSAIYGNQVTPAALCDDKGNAVVVQHAASPHWLEHLLRPVCTSMGCSAGFATAPLPGRAMKACAVPHTLSLAWRLGRAVLAARHRKADAVAAAAAEGHGAVLFSGKVVDVLRATAEGFAKGHLQLQGTGEHDGACLRIDFQNENLVASAGDHVLASVPDLICCLDADNGQPIQTEEMRYGLRISVLVLPAHPLLCTPEALAVVGPAAFGYEGVQYKPHCQHIETMSILSG